MPSSSRRAARPQQCKDAVKAVLDNFGGIDVLVNNAGITRDALVLSMKEEDFEKVIDTNLNSAFYMIKNTYHQFMKRRSGRIINISSISGLMGNAGQANYAAAFTFSESTAVTSASQTPGATAWRVVSGRASRALSRPT